MFSQHESDLPKPDRLGNTGASFLPSHEDSFFYEVQFEKEYVNRLKNQREKIETLYSKYDILLNELKGKDCAIKQKEKSISDLQDKLRLQSSVQDENEALRRHLQEAKQENSALLKSLERLEQQCFLAENRRKERESSMFQKSSEADNLNEKLLSKLKTVSKRAAEKDKEHLQLSNEMHAKMEILKEESRLQKSKLNEEIQTLKNHSFQYCENENHLLMENECLRERVTDMEDMLLEKAREYEEKLDKITQERKKQFKLLKAQLNQSQQNSDHLEKRLQKAKEENIIASGCLLSLKAEIERIEKTENEAKFTLRQQCTQEKNMLKEQLAFCESHVAKLQRRLNECLRREKEQQGIIRKFEESSYAKRGLREQEKAELQRINMLLNLQ